MQTGRFVAIFLLLGGVAVSVSLVSPAARASASTGLVITDLNNGVTPSDLANNLVGSGVTVSNVSYTGDNRAAGTFTGGSGIIGFGSGIVLDTGKVQTYPTDPPCSVGVEGPNTCYEAVGSNPPGPDGYDNSTAFGTPGDAQLTALSGFQTYDAAVLNFDFVPKYSTVQFTYVFSSEEYSDYANTEYNDVFGFFVNGTNCALVPGTSEPVSVNTINDGNDQGGDTTPHNAQYFINNIPPTLNTQMDGLTTVLTCAATVNANATNHLKLAIADASDDLLDSAVFIQAQSLSSGTTISTSLSGGGQNGPSIFVPPNTAVTDAAKLSGPNSANATGTVTYNAYSDAGCTDKVSPGTPEPIATPGTLPNSEQVTLSSPGIYYWQAVYSGDSNNNGVTSACGSETETVTGSVPSPDLNAVIQVETKSSLAGETVDISSLALESSCKNLSFETLQGGSVSSPTVTSNSIPVVLDGDGNATVVVNGVGCVPGKDLIEADLPKAPYLSATTTLVVRPPHVTPVGLTGYPADEVVTGNTPASGESDVYTVFYVETSGAHAGQKVEISSAALFDRCGEGSRWESNGTGSPFINSPTAIATIDNDGNAVFVFKGASCAAGTSTVSAEVEAGAHRNYTTKYVVEAPKVTLTTKHPAIAVSANPNPLILSGD